MDAELKAKWVAALRGGEFEQASGNFHIGGKYCCLGVLACVLTGIRGAAITTKHPGSDTLGGYLVDQGVPSKKMSTFVRMNDVEGKSFAEIADYIEANL